MLRPRNPRLAALVAGLIATALVAACSNAGGTPASPSAAGSAVPIVSAGPSAPASPTATATSAAATPTARPSARPSAKPTATKAPVRASPAPSHATAGATTGRISVPSAGFEITLPKGWKRLALDGSVAEDLAKVFPPDSDLGRLMSSQIGKAAIAGVKLWAFDLRPASLADGYASNLTVTVSGRLGGLSMAAYRELLLAQVKAIKEIRNVRSSLVKVPAGDAIRVLYDLVIEVPTGGTVTIAGTEYVIQDATHTFIVTFSCDPADASCPKAADAAARTVRATR